MSRQTNKRENKTIQTYVKIKQAENVKFKALVAIHGVHTDNVLY